MNPQQYLKQNGIEFKKFEHPPVYTCEDAEKYSRDIKGESLKNLFLKGKKGNYYLAILPAKDRADLKKIGKEIGEKISLASSERLREILNLTPGSVSPFGLINDVANRVTVLFDKKVIEQEYVSFHPNINTETLEMTQEEFRKYLSSINKLNSMIKI